MDINRVKETFDDIANKKLSGAISPDTFTRYCYLVTIDIFKLKAGLPEDYKPGQSLSAQGHQLTFKISDDIRHLITKTDINKNTSGFFPYPANYGAFDYALYGYIDNNCRDTKIRWKHVEPVTGAERAIRLDSHLIPPTLDYPILSYDATGWAIDPEVITQMRLSYLRLPNTPFWNYRMSGDQEIFDLTGANSTAFPNVPSVNIDFPETLFGDFVIRLCRYAGIELRENELTDYSLQRVNAGQ